MAKLLGCGAVCPLRGFGEAPIGSSASAVSEAIYNKLDFEIYTDLNAKSGYSCPKDVPQNAAQNTCAVVLAKGPSRWRDMLRADLTNYLATIDKSQRQAEGQSVISDLAQKFSTQIDSTVAWADIFKEDLNYALSHQKLMTLAKEKQYAITSRVLPPVTPLVQTLPPTDYTMYYVAGGVLALAAIGGYVYYTQTKKPGTMAKNRRR